MINIYNVRYQMELRGGGDLWRIAGEADNHPNVPPGHTIYPSSPVSFDEENDIFVTSSGREYKIDSYDWEKGRFVEQITKDITNQGFEVH